MPILLYFVWPKHPSGNCYIRCFLTDRAALDIPNISAIFSKLKMNKWIFPAVIFGSLRLVKTGLWGKNYEFWCDFLLLKYSLSIYELGQNFENHYILAEYQCNNKICGIYVQSLSMYIFSSVLHSSLSTAKATKRTKIKLVDSSILFYGRNKIWCS